MYENGYGTHRSFAEALRWYRRAADHGHTFAQYNLGVMYSKGRGVTRDDAEALRWFRKAADQGSAEAQTGLGVMYYEGRGVGQDYIEAARWYRRAAVQGYVYAEFNLGTMFEKGKGVIHDDAKALQLYRDAAANGDASAQAHVGIFYRDGQGVPRDYEKAILWFQRSANLRDADGQDNLGDMYENGHGVAQDYFEAARWYRKAADQGYARGEYNLGTMYENGRGVAQDYAEAARWYRLAADQDDADAQYNLGTLFFNGRGVHQDYVEAVRWYIASARGGNDTSREIVSRAYLDADDPLHSDLVVSPNLQAALHNAAADIGISFEESKLDCFSYMVDCGEIAWRRLDLAKAASWYRMEAATDPEAAFLLGRLLDAHPELEQSLGEALTHLHFAANAGNPEAGFLLATRDLAAVPVDERLGRIEAALAPLSPAKAIELAFAGATGRFSDPVIAPAYLYLRSRADQGITEAAVGLIYVYTFYGAYGEAEKVAGTLGNADWFELSGWDYSIDHSLDFWLEQINNGNILREGSLDGLQHLLSTLSTKGSQTAPRLLSKLNSVKEAAAAYSSSLASEPVMPVPTTVEWQAAIDRIQARIAEKQKLGGLSPLIVELYQALSRAQAALGEKEEAVKSALIALSTSEQINIATRYQKGSLVYHLEQSCQLRKASEYLNGLDQNELSLLLAKAAVNELQDARTELTGLPAGLQGCFRDQISDQYRVLADLFIRQGHFLEAEWILGQLKDFETYEFNRDERVYAGGALGHTPMTDNQNRVLAQITSLPLQELLRLNQRLEDLDRDTDPTDAVRVEKTAIQNQLLKAKEDLDVQLATLRDSVTKLKPPSDPATLNVALTPGGIDNLASALAELPANTAIFYTAVLPDRIHILITTSAGTEHLVVPIPEEQLNGMIGDARAKLQDSTKDPIPALQALYDLLWKAADPELRKLGVTDVVLSLDRKLRYLPFDALHDGQSYLAERYRFTLLTAKQNTQLLAPGGFPSLSVQAFGTSLGRSPDFDPLPNVPQEIDGIVKDPGVDKDGVLSGKRWLDSAFNRNGLGDALASHPPIVHIATHFAVGTSDETTRMLLGDGPMSLTDIKKVITTHAPAFHDIRLLVLSACETAFGNGNELESMAAVMQDSGVKSVIATLWPIADQSTAAFMVRFYTYLNLGLPRGEALRRTQLDFIYNRQDDPAAKQPDTPVADIAPGTAETGVSPTHVFERFSHPRYWAPFILMGQWK
jgi:TPR repeat protein/CHAT domain-containing protein